MSFDKNRTLTNKFDAVAFLTDLSQDLRMIDIDKEFEEFIVKIRNYFIDNYNENELHTHSNYARLMTSLYGLRYIYYLTKCTAEEFDADAARLFFTTSFSLHLDDLGIADD